MASAGFGVGELVRGEVGRRRGQGADLLLETLPDYLSGRLKPVPQPEEGVTAGLAAIEAVKGEQLDDGIDQADVAGKPERESRFQPIAGTAGQPLEIQRAGMAHGPAQ